MDFILEGPLGTRKLVTPEMATLQEFVTILKGLDWDWWRRENPELWTAGEAAMRAAFLAAEARGAEFQEAFVLEFKSRNPGLPTPQFGSG